MIAAADDEGRLSEDEIYSNATFLMTAGHETATQSGSPTPTASTLRAATTATWPSATARTSASARPSRARQRGGSVRVGSVGSIIYAMKVASGKVVGGKVVLEGDAFAEGAEVTVLAREDDETFSVSPEQEGELLSAIAELERGESVPAAELLARLRSPT